MKRIYALIAFAVFAPYLFVFAGQGMGPGPGVKAYASGNFACDTFAGTANSELATQSLSCGGTWVAGSQGTGGLQGLNAGGGITPSANNNPWVYYTSVSSPSADYTVTGTINNAGTTGDSSLGLVCRASTTQNTYYAVNWTGAAWALQKRVNGSFSAIGVPSISGSPATDQIVTLSCVGSTISVSVVGQSNPIITTTDTDITAAGRAGVINFYSGVSQSRYIKSWSAL